MLLKCKALPWGFTHVNVSKQITLVEAKNVMRSLPSAESQRKTNTMLSLAIFLFPLGAPLLP